MNISAPNYLSEITDTVRSTNDSIVLSFKCACGNKDFAVFSCTQLYEKGEDSRRIDKKYTELLRDTVTGKTYWVKRNIFGVIVDRIEQAEVSLIDSINIVKLKCMECGHEYIIFDNRKHGYDGVFSDHIDLGDTCMQFEQKNIKLGTQSAQINAKLYYSETYEEFIQDNGKELTIDDYKLAFTSIAIFAHFKHKKVRLFSFETA